MQETQESQVRSLCGENPLEEDMATHSSISCLDNPRDRRAWWATFYEMAKSQTRQATEHTAESLLTTKKEGTVNSY